MSLFDFKPLETYEYTPLSPAKRVFRLVQLLPPKPSLIPDVSGTIRIRLSELDIDSGGRYDALSYSWNVPAGQVEPNRQIIVETDDGSRKLYIFPALESALLHLTSQRMTDRIFIDQISINQKDKEEKSHQVLLMQDIYTTSARTLVWLGPPTRESDQYFDVVREICSEGVLSRLIGPRVSQVMHVFDAVMNPTLPVDEEQQEDRDDLLDLIARYGSRFPLGGFADVLDRTWFNRLWVIQEACLAPSVIFLCGSKSLCLDCFRSSALFYSIFNTHWARNLNKAVPQRVIRERDAIYGKMGGLNRIFQERKAIHETMKRRRLQELILKYNVNDHHKKIGATMEQDRIFGLLGLAGNDDTVKKRVRVDYNAKVTQMYSEIAEILLQESIDILLFNQHPKKTQGLPSWVPDWAMDLSIPVSYVALEEPTSSAGGPMTEAPTRLEGEELQLHIRGILVDEIQEVGRRLHQVDSNTQVSEEINYRSAKLFFDEVSEFTRMAAATALSRDPSLSAADAELEPQLRLCDSSLSYRHFTQSLGAAAGIRRLQALHSAVYSLGERLIRSDETIASYRLTRIYRTIGIVPWYWQPMSEMESLRTCALDPVLAGKIAGQAIQDFVIDMTGLCVASARVWYASKYTRYRRRFGKLSPRPDPESVRKIGLDADVSLGPDITNMRADDSIVIFRGGTTPHILRKLYNGGNQEEKYEYLGEAYCDGFMDGEILQDETKREEMFVLV
ncbi:hypothetical protein BBK36DRAFT_1125681 [Trichoderma citrinoviride]|uniref:Heterokaryon incompatibility domain-containing protein n=1 Tax=Trichoderma citrinoviride TaxID=58853 RepID=A0A2T4B2S9_9HYPO|nr:hypothetical protein BBK36DRAFT_1125681 [Trichoderma citrinoviride]PTB63610.1 hypothetical protein BBK36DRAFT_1125681 [Trichoderma citrinoviride]